MSRCQKQKAKDGVTVSSGGQEAIGCALRIDNYSALRVVALRHLMAEEVLPNETQQTRRKPESNSKLQLDVTSKHTQPSCSQTSPRQLGMGYD